MKNFKLPFCILLVLALFLTPLIGYGETDEAEIESAEVTAVVSAEEEEGAEDNTENIEEAKFSYSDSIDGDGLWEGITALDYVELPAYMAISVPSDTHAISDDSVQSQIDSILANFTTEEQITDRAVKDGDTVNIDYVGSVDGVEFDGGTTGGNGTDVTIGETSYIDDFLEQLIGHTPGETINVEVTFPEDYGVVELNGKDAVFVTIINYISTAVKPELNDDFIAENLSDYYGWTTIDEMREGIYSDLQKSAIESYVQDYLINDSKVNSMPDLLMEYQENAMLSYYSEYAAYFGMEFDEFLSAYMGVASSDELKESNYDNNAETAKYYLIAQAVAEDAGITVSDDDVANFFKEYYDTDDYSSYEEQYGMPYLKQNVLCMLVIEHVSENAVLE